MTHAQTVQWLESHGIQVRVHEGTLEALSAWTHDGLAYGDWEPVTCTLPWLRNWMNY
jgi:hypothetical protein